MTGNFTANMMFLALCFTYIFPLLLFFLALYPVVLLGKLVSLQCVKLDG